MKSEIFTDLEKLYNNKNPLVRNIFWKRIQAALELAQINDNSILLDIGCGTGHLLKSIRKSNDQCECWGTDIIEHEDVKIVNCKVQVADARNLPFKDNYFNVVFALDTLEHIEDDVDKAIEEIRRVLVPYGIAILSGPTESWFYKFCRSLLFYQFKKKIKSHESIIRGEIDYHFHSIYSLEPKFFEHGFKLVKRKYLPPPPMLSLFRVGKFQK